MEAASPISKNYGKSLKKSIHRTFSSTPCENLAPNNYQNGILQTPPTLYHSFPPFLAHQKQQPPLLPLPIPKTSVHVHQHYNTLSQNRAFSLPPTNRKVKPKKNKSSPKKDQESPKSSKVAMVSSTNPLGPDPKDLPKDVSVVLSMSSTGGKEPSFDALSFRYVRSPKKNDANRNQLSLLHMTSRKDQSVGALSSCYARSPKKDDASRNQLSLLHMTSGKEPSVGALSSGYVRSPKKDDANRNQLSPLHMTIEKDQSVGRSPKNDDANRNQLSLLQTKSLKETDKFSSSVVFTTVSPPPSSLPLPTFSLRPKLSCNAEASAGVDAGATDNLRRLLRLR